MTVKTDYRSRLLQDAIERAPKNLAEHVVTQRHNDGDAGRLWRCAKPQSSSYAFTIYAPPGWLIFTGDMGESMWSREYDMIEFARKSINSLWRPRSPHDGGSKHSG
jgi:hypothetical protein